MFGGALDKLTVNMQSAKETKIKRDSVDKIAGLSPSKLEKVEEKKEEKFTDDIDVFSKPEKIDAKKEEKEE